MPRNESKDNRIEKIPDNSIDFLAQLHVEGRKINTKSTLKAYFGELEAELEIVVAPEETFYPSNGFAFVPKSVNLTKNKKKKIKLVLDTNLVKPGTPIEVSSDDQRIRKVASRHLIMNLPQLTLL